LFLKIQHWPGASISMILGLIITGFIVLPWYTWFTWKDDKYVSSRFLFLIIGSLTIIIPGALVNLSMQHSYEAGFYPQLEQQQIMYKHLYRNNTALVTGYHDSVRYIPIEQLHSKTTGLLSSISSIQVRMVQESEGKPGVPAVADNQIRQSEYGPKISYRLLSNPFSATPVSDFLLPGSGPRRELDKAMADYLSYLSGLTLGNELQESVNLIQSSALLPEENPDGKMMSLISGLHSLELLKNNILIIESNVLTTVTKR